VRTTLTLDDDVAAKLKSVARRTGRAFRDVVNDALRRGLANAPRPQSRERFVVEARELGRRRPGLNLDNIADLVEQVEGPLHR
jgi:hypothetical protein